MVEYNLLTNIILGLLTLIAASWAAVSLYDWWRKPKFRITFPDGKTSIACSLGYKGSVMVQFENVKQRPATNIHTYLMFPKEFVIYNPGSGFEVSKTTPGGKFPECQFVYNAGYKALFQEEATTLKAEMVIAGDIKAKAYELHALIFCDEGSFKTCKLKILVQK